MMPYIILKSIRKSPSITAEKGCLKQCHPLNFCVGDYSQNLNVTCHKHQLDIFVSERATETLAIK